MFKQTNNQFSDIKKKNEKSHPQFDHIFLSEILQKNIIFIVVLYISTQFNLFKYEWYD